MILARVIVGERKAFAKGIIRNSGATLALWAGSLFQPGISHAEKDHEEDNKQCYVAAIFFHASIVLGKIKS
ncbi:MAG: hypothetical protein U1D97_08470 [Desulfuromonadales bacterium]|nr:hypothetical protein [Desulfuromonadales bacterium]